MAGFKIIFMYEIETKVLGIDAAAVIKQLEDLGAKQVQDTKLVVDWFGPKGLTHNGDDPWFMRVRSYSSEVHEVTWKGISNHIGQSRQTQEINFTVSDPDKIKELLSVLDFENYAHQEKYRKSFTYKDWRFDIDQYPGMPAFVEIEGQSEEYVQEAMKMLNVSDNKTFNKGERMLVQDEYGLNWFNMKF